MRLLVDGDDEWSVGGGCGGSNKDVIVERVVVAVVVMIVELFTVLYVDGGSGGWLLNSVTNFCSSVSLISPQKTAYKSVHI